MKQQENEGIKNKREWTKMCLKVTILYGYVYGLINKLIITDLESIIQSSLLLFWF